MKKIALSISSVAVLLMTVLPSSAKTVDALTIKSFTLDNGLTVWINEDPNQSSVLGAVVVKAGAADCPGTGIAHYFEHMMFKGTDKIGTLDYAAEKVYLDSISVKYDELALTESDSLRKEIQMEINRLSIKASDYVVPNEFDNLIAEMGGSSLNAFTAFDETVYHNKFLPEYFAQWAELNSERVINPVFRLFQSELETVYEEKNRKEDNIVNDLLTVMLANVFDGTGYSQDAIGTTENLKNPRLSQMREFFEKYYVACNMGLVLTGNIKAEEAMPVIRKTFGRIPAGKTPERIQSAIVPIQGRKDVEAMLNVPLIKLGAVCFQGPSKRDPDYLGASFLMSMLNNDSGTGLFDKMMVDHKLLMAQAMSDLSFKDAGSIVVFYAPKMFFQREKKATGMILGAFEDLRKGNFTDEFFESCKKSFKKAQLASLENIDDRMVEMAYAFAEDTAWDEVLARADAIDAITKEDIMAIADKYCNENCILVHKKKGTAPKDNLKKPDYEKVVPQNKDASSAYALALRKSAENIKPQLKAVDYQKDVQTRELAPLVKLYASSNPYNDVFDLTLSFQVGKNEKPALERVAGYVTLLGTEDKSFDQVSGELQTMGAGVYFFAKDNSFDVNVTGFDSNLDRTLDIVADLLDDIEGDPKKLRTTKINEKSNLVFARKDMNELERALYTKVLYGEKSPYVADKGKFTDDALLDLFEDVQEVECDILYSGSLDADRVAEYIKKHFDLDDVAVASNAPVDFEPVSYDKPQVFFLDKKDASQSQCRALVNLGKVDNLEDRFAMSCYNAYLGGGGMSNLLFQEIREFRSMAYATRSYLLKPSYKNRTDRSSILAAFVGTQSDKTIEAMDVMDSLVTCTPFLAAKMKSIGKEEINTLCAEYPDFRSLPSYVADDIRAGYEKDPNPVYVEIIDSMDPAAMEGIWKKYISGKNRVWTIVGAASKVDMAALEKFGPVTTVKSSEVMK